MTRIPYLAALLLVAAAVAVAASVGSGAATPAIQASFINAYNRGIFSLFVNTPTTDVRALGTPGLIQEFPSKTSASARYALIKPDPNAPLAQFDTLQVSSDIYALFTSVGVATAGYPTMDTTECPVIDAAVCNYQIFTRKYALFSYSSPTTANFTVRDPFYTAWQTRGGISGILGPVTNSETAVTSVTGVAATQQAFAGGTVYSYPAGSATPTVRSLTAPFFALWANNGGLAFLGLPTSDAIQLSVGGPVRQTFEAGRIEQSPGQEPVILLPVSVVGITFASQGLTLQPGGTATITATTLDTRGTSVVGRSMTWSSTNGAVVRVTGNGYTATLQAVGAGTANIFATVEGKTSPPISVRVGGACCLVGEGAPTQVMSQAFQTALDRNQLTANLPVAATVTRTGSGYTQTVSVAGTAYVISIADSAGTAYLSAGPIYSAYVANGGFSGPLGYPASDPLPGGAQRYVSGAALAGNPVRLVPVVIAGKWLTGGGATGLLGSPTSDAAAFQSLFGTSGITQTFSTGAIFGFASGVAWQSTGPILARYLALGGAAGAMGAPKGDIANGRQDFETGYIDMQPGAAEAVEHFNARKPALSVSPSTVVPGGRVRIAASGFAPGATLNFSVTGQAGFSVRAAAGIFEWDTFIPPSAKAGVVSIQAAIPGNAESATATYSISPASALLPKLTLLSGDQQTGAPGSTLAAPIVLALVDSSGSPIAGVPVTWTLSPGASVTGAATTDANGRAAGFVRLSTTSGVLVGAATAAGQTITFSALSAARSISGFPAFPQTAPGGGPLASLASLLRYEQDQGRLGSPRGLTSVVTLDAFLNSNKGYAVSDSGLPIVNPWVATAYAGAGIALEVPTLNTIRDLVSVGTPVAVVLSLQVNGAPSGSTVVDAIGIRNDGAVMIVDPDPAFAAGSLADYLAGFSAGGKQVVGSMVAVLRVTPVSPGPNAFTIATPLSADATAGAPAGPCSTLALAEPASTGGVRFHFCDPGLATTDYELDLAARKGAGLVNLNDRVSVSLPADDSVAWKLSRVSGVLTAERQNLSVGTVTDAASFGDVIAPGAIISVFGTGLAPGGRSPVVSLAGRNLQVLYASPWQLNAVVPSDLASGNLMLQVTGALGTVSQAIQLASAAPGIFVIGLSDQKPLGAVINQDGTVNGPRNPAQRGQFISIYATGLGATTLRNGLQATTQPVTVSVNGATPIAASFSGAVAGFVGLYQVNVQIPVSTPPSSATTLTLVEGGRSSNQVVVALQ